MFPFLKLVLPAQLTIDPLECHFKIIGTILKTRNEDVGNAEVGQTLLGRSQKPYMLGQTTVPLPNVPVPHPHRHKEVKIS